MFYAVESDKSFYEACLDFEPVVQRLGFVILGSHALGDMLHGEAREPDDDCRVYAVGNYRLSEKLLTLDMRLSLLLPWRISVFTENGATKLGFVLPEPLLSGVSAKAEVAGLAREIEEKLRQIIDEAR